MKELKKLTAFTVLLVLLFTFSSASAADSVYTRATASLGKGSVDLLTVMPGAGVIGEIATANGNVTSDAAASTFVTAKNAEKGKSLLFAANGGFFNAYYSSSSPLSIPSNYPITYAMLVNRGEIINGGSGSLPMLAFGYDGKAAIDTVTVTNTAVVRDGGASFSIWHVNKWNADPSAVMLFTDKCGLSVPIPSSSRMYYIRNNTVTDVKTGSALSSVPAGTKILVLNSSVIQRSEGYGTLPEKGNRLEIVSSFTPSSSDSVKVFADIYQAIGTGPLLVKDGKDVSAAITSSDVKQSAGYVSSRSFAAIWPDGRFSLGTASSASMKQIAVYLVSLGVKDAVALDGGASATLYSSDSGFIRKAGRRLTNMLTIVSVSSMPVKKTVTDQPAFWSSEDTDTLRADGLIPDGLDGGYQSNITRQEFCQLVMRIIEMKAPVSRNQLILNTGIAYADVRESYTDAYHIDVIDATRLGIVSGRGNKIFDPNGCITREEAAKMLSLAAGYLGISEGEDSLSFSDKSTFSSWAVEYIDFVSSIGVMQGSSGRFNPKDYYTREQSFVTMANLLRAMS